MTKTSRWLDRNLIVSPYYYALCITPQAFVSELKSLKVPKDSWPAFVMKGTSACCHFFTSDDGKNSCIICLSGYDSHTLIQVYALLVHEAMHLWQAIKKDIGEDEASAEFEAYSVQAICQRLFDSYEQQRSKK